MTKLPKEVAIAMYNMAMDNGKLTEAYSIAYANQAAFDWAGEYPEDWTDEQIAEHSLS